MPSRPFQPSHLYAQVRHELAQRIARGDYPPGSLLPNEFSLASEMQVSVGTVRKAVEMLTAEKLVSRMQGRGTTVADRKSANYRGMFDRIRAADGTPVTWRFREILREVKPPSDLEKQKLQIRGDRLVISIQRVREFRDRVVCSEFCCLPFDLYGDIEGVPIQETTVEALSALKGVTISSSDERLTLVHANARLTEEFSVPEGSILIRLERIVYDSSNDPIEWRTKHCNLGDLQYHVPSPIGSRSPK